MSDFNPWSGGVADAHEAGLANEADLQKAATQSLARGEPTAAEFADEYAAPGRAAAHRRGVRWIADYQTLDDGMCRHARQQARALHDFGIATHLQSMTHLIRTGRPAPTGDPLEDMLALPPGMYAASEDLMDREVRAFTDPMVRQTIAKPDVVVRQAPFASHREFLAYAVPRYAHADPKLVSGILSRTVAYLPWERSTLDERFADALNQCAQVWLQSSRHLDVFRRAGVDASKLELIPNTYDEESPVAKLGVSGKPMPTGKRFYHIGKWEPRKNQVKLLGAFLQNFSPRDAATLFIKTSPFGGWKDYPGPAAALEHWLADTRVIAKGWTWANYDSRIRIVDVTYSEEDLAKIHASNNIYVSSGAGEAWDYPAFDAKLAGNRLLYVGFGGPEDYASSSDMRVPWKLGPVHEGYPWGEGAEWAEYSVETLGERMRQVTAPRQRSVELSMDVRPRVMGASMAHALSRVVGLSVKQWLDAGASNR